GGGAEGAGALADGGLGVPLLLGGLGAGAGDLAPVEEAGQRLAAGDPAGGGQDQEGRPGPQRESAAARLPCPGHAAGYCRFRTSRAAAAGTVSRPVAGAAAAAAPSGGRSAGRRRARATPAVVAAGADVTDWR